MNNRFEFLRGPGKIILGFLFDLKGSQLLEIDAVVFYTPARHRSCMTLADINRTAALNNKISSTRYTLAQVFKTVLDVNLALEGIWACRCVHAAFLLVVLEPDHVLERVRTVTGTAKAYTYQAMELMKD